MRMRLRRAHGSIHSLIPYLHGSHWRGFLLSEVEALKTSQWAGAMRGFTDDRCDVSRSSQEIPVPQIAPRRGMLHKIMLNSWHHTHIRRTATRSRGMCLSSVGVAAVYYGALQPPDRPGQGTLRIDSVEAEASICERRHILHSSTTYLVERCSSSIAAAQCMWDAN